MLKIEIISPAGVIFEGLCHLATLPSAAGEIGVMQDHEAFVSALHEGKIMVYNDKQEVLKEVAVGSGFAEIHDGQKLVVLVN